MRSRALSAVVAGVVSSSDGRDGQYTPRTSASRQIVDVDSEDNGSSSSDRDAASIDLLARNSMSSPGGDEAAPPIASRPNSASTTIMSPSESAPPASTSFLRERSHADMMTDSDNNDEDDEQSSARMTPHSLDARLDHRFSSPALGRRRYPSTSISAGSGKVPASSARTGPSSRLRRTSASFSQPHHSPAPAMFDVKGKGVARDGYYNVENDVSQGETAGNGFALLAYDHGDARQGDPRYAPLLPHHQITNRRSISHSVPTRRYTTAFDPSMDTPHFKPSSVLTRESPDFPTRVKKKRSYTFSGGGGGIASGKGASGGKSKDELLGSSSPDSMQGGFTPLSSSQHNSATSKRRSSHLPRSASDFIYPSAPAGMSSSDTTTKSKYPRQSNSGSTSPLYPRSHSGNILGTQRPMATASSATRSSTLPPDPEQESPALLRNKLSGLQMKSKSISRISPNKTTFTPPQKTKEGNTLSAQPSTRKRAKSSLYPLEGGRESVPRGNLSPSLPPARSASSQYLKRWNTISDPESDPQYAATVFAKQCRGDHNSPGRRVHMHRDVSDSSPFEPLSQQDKTALNRTVATSFPKNVSGSQPISIAALVNEDAQAGSFANSVPEQGPSLQDLLGTVDLKGALTLVREAAGNIGEANTFQSTGIRTSLDAPSTYRPPSSSRNITLSDRSSRTSAASPATNGSNKTSTPLLSGQTEGLEWSNNDKHTEAQLQASPTVHFVAPTYDVASEKKRKRISMKRLLGHSHTSHSRTSSQETSTCPDDRSSFSGSSPINVEPNEAVHITEEVRNRVDPTMRKYIASVKSELEIRYLPIYTAIAMGHDPPNPLAVARHLYVQEEPSKSKSVYSLSPDSNSHQCIEEAQPSRRAVGEAGNGQHASLADRIRKKGHKRSVWEVCPRDIAAFTMASKNPNINDPYGHRSEVLETFSRTKHANHRHASSEISLGSLPSINEERPLHAFRPDNRHGLSSGPSHSTRQDRGQSGLPYSPTRSRSGQSDASSYIASDDAIAAGHTSLLGKSTSDLAPGLASEGHLQSSPEYSKFSASLPNNHSVHHKSSLSWSNRGLKLLRADPHYSHSLLRHSGKSSHEELESTSYPLGSVGKGGTESEGGLGEKNTSSFRPAFHRSTASDIGVRVRDFNTDGAYHRPGITRSISKASSLAGFSKIMAGRKSIRTLGRHDGYRSNTDNEESRSNQGALGVIGSNNLSRSENTSRQSNLPQSEVDPHNAEEKTEGSVFGLPELHVQEIDVGDEEMDTVERFLHELKSSLSKAEALERRTPPKMQTYVQSYYDYDAQRLQKGQLALVQLPPPPMLCRHFRSGLHVPANQDEASLCTPGQEDTKLKDDRHDASIHRSAYIDRPSCTRRNSNSSLEDDEKRTPLLEKVTHELDDATDTLEKAIKRSQEILEQQDSAKSKITETVDLANSVETLIGGEVFQQLRMLEDHLMRLTYHATDSRGYADAAWAVLSYILRIFFWFSWIGVTILRLIKATIMLPFTVVVTILRWIFL